MLYQPTNITPSTLNGTGIIDPEQELTVSWQLGGDPSDLLTGWQIVIMQNDTDSTVVYDSGIQRNWQDEEHENYLSYPAWAGTKWRTQSWTIPAGSLSGLSYLYDKGYKLRINQLTAIWDEETRLYNDDYVIEQVSPVYIRCARVPKLIDWAYGDTVDAHTAYFYTGFDNDVNYYWEGGQMICPYPVAKYCRAMLALGSTDNVVYDSGWKLSNSVSGYGPSGLVDGMTYYVKLFLEDTNQFQLDTGWQAFTVAYNYAQTDGTLTAYYVPGKPCIFLQFSDDAPSVQWDIYRQSDDAATMEHVGIVDSDQRYLFDYGVKNRTEYTYHAFRYNSSTSETEHLESNTIAMRKYFDWAIIETEPEAKSVTYMGHTASVTEYHVTRTHIFQGNVESGDITNGAGPDINESFTGYPMVQKNLRKALSGKLKAVVGRVTNGQFTDSIQAIDAIFAMAQNTTVKFLRDRKGYLHRIEIGGDIIRKYNDKNAEQSTTVTVPWIEVGSADGCMIGIWEDDANQPGDAIINTRTTDLGDGNILWTYGEGYKGSMIDMDEDGYLIQTYEESASWTPATLTITNGRLIANGGEV